MNLELRDICLKFSHKVVLQKLNLKFEEGQLHALLGQNGAGKTTAANIICGEISPDSGQILIDGEAVKFRNPRAAIQRGISYVHQRPMLADSITIKENLLLGLNKEQKKQLIPQAQKWLPEIDLNSLVKNYGADIRFFIALTSALIKSPDLLILDEPSALLDEKEETFLFEKLNLLASRGMNIIIITHNYQEAQKYCRTIHFLEDGKVFPFDPSKNQLPDLNLNKSRASKKQKEEIFNLCINNFSFEIQKGKITLIKGLAQDGLEELEKNLIAMRALKKFPQPLNSTCGLIPTDRKFTASNPNLSIEQMLTAGLKIEEKQKTAAASQMISSSGVNINAEEKCSCLSGGMLQKLILEREFFSKPDFLILCNPLQGLDVETCQKICERIRNAAQQGVWVLVLSYGAFPSEYSDKEYRIFKGRVEAI